MYENIAFFKTQWNGKFPAIEIFNHLQIQIYEEKKRIARNAHAISRSFQFSLVAVGNEIRSELVTAKVIQFQKTEWEIFINESFNNPYLQEDIAIDMELKSPSGKKINLPCYYKSGESGKVSNWMARFTPREVGEYEYYFQVKKNGQELSKSKSLKIKVSASNKNGFLNLNNFWSLKFDNGEPFRGIGENLCWESRSNDDSKYFKELHEQPRFNYEYLLPKLASNGGNFTRIWMCPWNLPLEWKIVSPNTNRYQNTTEYFNPGAIAKMDRLIELADSLEVYIMLTLDQAGNYMGGSWESSNYKIKNGGFASDAKDFFLNPKSKQQYKNRLRYLIARWGYSPSIAMWEFFNEIDYLSFDKDTSDHSRRDAVVAWHDEMSSYLKQSDPYGHLITTSISHRDVIGLNSIKNIDINQKHIYKYTQGIPQVIEEYVHKFNKAYVIGEFGYEWDWSKNFNEYGSEMDSDFKRGLWYGLFSPTPVIPMSWWWEFFESRGMMEYFSSVRTISDLMLKSGKGQFSKLEIKGSSEKVHNYGIQCGSTVFVYIFNSDSIEKKYDLDFSSNVPNKDVRLYNCEKKTFESFNSLIKNNSAFSLKQFTIPAKQDYVIVINNK